jgi:hypothetical protein
MADAISPRHRTNGSSGGVIGGGTLINGAGGGGYEISPIDDGNSAVTSPSATIVRDSPSSTTSPLSGPSLHVATSGSDLEDPSQIAKSPVHGNCHFCTLCF